MNERRRAMVKLAFNVLDKDRSGEIDLSDIKDVYDAKSHPDVAMKKRTEEEVLQEFIQNFQTGKEKDDIVTLKEFEEYYANVSASIDDDDYFELMIRNAWHISGGEGWCANTTNRRVLVTHADGRQTVEEITNDLGLKGNDKKGMMQRLKAQGLQTATINTGGIEDMGHQYEDPDFVNYRGTGQQQLGQRGQQQQRRQRGQQQYFPGGAGRNISAGNARGGGDPSSGTAQYHPASSSAGACTSAAARRGAPTGGYGVDGATRSAYSSKPGVRHVCVVQGLVDDHLPSQLSSGSKFKLTSG